MGGRRDDVRETLRRRVLSDLHLGFVRPGQRLASARETARELGTDYRVVVAAGRALEREGLLEIRPRAGIFVGRNAPLAEAAHPELVARLVALLVDEVVCRLPAPSFVERVRRSLETVRLRAACIECNQDQLDSLCRELEVEYGLASTGVEVDRLRRGVPPAVHQADLLVSTSFHAGMVRRLADRLGKACVIVTLDAVWCERIVTLLAERPVYFIGTDPRWARKVHVIWGAVAGADNLRPVTIGHDCLESIPATAAVVMMPGARRLLAGSPLLARALPEGGFSRETARQLLHFVVHSNVEAWRTRAGRGAP
jgi:DNA-binding transcriptional regulator YhcF (GntR family)